MYIYIYVYMHTYYIYIYIYLYKQVICKQFIFYSCSLCVIMRMNNKKKLDTKTF